MVTLLVKHRTHSPGVLETAFAACIRRFSEVSPTLKVDKNLHLANVVNLIILCQTNLEIYSPGFVRL